MLKHVRTIHDLEAMFLHHACVYIYILYIHIIWIDICTVIRPPNIFKHTIPHHVMTPLPRPKCFATLRGKSFSPNMLYTGCPYVYSKKHGKFIGNWTHPHIIPAWNPSAPPHPPALAAFASAPGRRCYATRDGDVPVPGKGRNATQRFG